MNFLLPYLMRWNSLNKSRYHQLFSRLAARGHRVDVLQPPAMASADTGFSEVEEAPPEMLAVHDVRVNSFFWNRRVPFNKIFKKAYYCLSINQQIEKLIKDLSVDVILFYNLALYPLSKIDGCFKIYDLGDDHVELLKHELGIFNNKLVLSRVDQFMKRLLHSCDLVTTVSQDLAKKYSVRPYVLPNGVNPGDHVPGSGAEIRDRLGTPLVGFVGSLEYFIDFDLIVETAASMKHTTFLIAGGGRQFERLNKIKRERNMHNLHLTGGLSHSEIFRHIDAMDICLNLFVKSPLTDAACPIKLFEYLACKKPVITSRIREVQNIDEGFLYYADRVDELVSTIDQILTRPEEVARRTEKGFQLIEKRYNWDKIVDEFLDVLSRARERSSSFSKRQHN